MLVIEVAMATRQSQQVIGLSVPVSATIEEVIALSNIAQHFPEVDWSLLGSERLAVGIFGLRKSLQDIVQAGDRVEIYHPLRQSALDARKQRVADKKMASQK